MPASKSIVIYHSKYGSTKKYAEWISQKTGSDIVSLSDFNPDNLKNYQTVIFGSFAYMGKLKGSDFIAKNQNSLLNKKLFVFCVSAALPNSPENSKILHSSFTPEIQKSMTYFSFHGAYDYSRMDNTDKMIMLVPRFLMWLKWKISRDASAKKFLDEFYTSQDWTNPSWIEPLVNAVLKS